jgi:hypothetical protein
VRWYSAVCCIVVVMGWDVMWCVASLSHSIFCLSNIVFVLILVWVFFSLAMHLFVSYMQGYAMMDMLA